MALDPTAAQAPESFIQIGRLGRTFQLEGAIRVLLDEAVSYSYEDEDGQEGADPVGVRAVRTAGRIFVAGLGNVRVRELYETGGSLLIKLEGVRERNAAQLLVNATLWVDPTLLPPELADELAAEVEAGSTEERLIGRPVLVDGQRVGEVSAAMLESPNPVVEVSLDPTGVEAPADDEKARRPKKAAKPLVPLQAPYVEVTDLGIELTDPPTGLLEPA